MPWRLPSTASRWSRLISAGSVTNSSEPTCPRPSASSTVQRLRVEVHAEGGLGRGTGGEAEVEVLGQLAGLLGRSHLCQEFLHACPHAIVVGARGCAAGLQGVLVHDTHSLITARLIQGQIYTAGSTSVRPPSRRSTVSAVSAAASAGSTAVNRKSRGHARGEEPVTGSDDRRERDQAVLVHQVRRGQRVHQAQAADDDDVPLARAPSWPRPAGRRRSPPSSTRPSRRSRCASRRAWARRS